MKKIFSQFPITNYYKLKGLNNENLFLTVLETKKSKIMILVNSIPGKSSLLDLKMAAFSLCPPMIHDEGEEEGEKERERTLMSLLKRTLILLNQVPTFMTSFNLNYLLIDPISKYSQSEG